MDAYNRSGTRLPEVSFQSSEKVMLSAEIQSRRRLIQKHPYGTLRLCSGKIGKPAFPTADFIHISFGKRTNSRKCRRFLCRRIFPLTGITEKAKLWRLSADHKIKNGAMGNRSRVLGCVG